MQEYVALLGTKGGPAVRPGSAMPTSSLLVLDGQHIVIDCGLGVTGALIGQDVGLDDLSAVYITHLHSDHYLELGPLLYTAWIAGRKEPLDVWGPTGLGQYWSGFMASMREEIDLRIEDEGREDLGGLVRLHVLEEGRDASAGPVAVEAMRVVHPPLQECYALSFRSGKRHVVFSGDTVYMPKLAEFARGADLLVHEAILEDALVSLVERVGTGDDRLLFHLRRSHTRAEDVGALASEAEVKALAINHLIPSDDPAYGESDWTKAVRSRWPGPLHVGRDGLRVDL